MFRKLRFIAYYFKTAFYFKAINSPRFNAIILGIMRLKVGKYGFSCELLTFFTKKKIIATTNEL